MKTIIKFLSPPYRAAMMIALICFAILFLTVILNTFALVNQVSTTPVVHLLGDKSVELNGERKGSLSDLAQLKATLARVFSERKKSESNRPGTKPSVNSCGENPVIVKADAFLKYGSVADLVLALRDIGGDPIKVEVSSAPHDPYAITPGMPCAVDLPNIEPGAYIKPNPLTLLVTVTPDHRLKLNGDDIGTLDDTSNLIQRLSLLFQNRAEQKVFRPGTDRVEATTYIKAPRSLYFGDVTALMDAVKQAGADPTGLQVDDLQP